MEDQVAIHTVDDLIQGQFLAPELDEMIELQKFAEKVRLCFVLCN